MINKKAQKEALVAFDEIKRDYTDTELREFHTNIQKFWGEPRTVTVRVLGSGVAQKFDHEALAVAYGAARKVDSGSGRFHYLYGAERYRQLNNIWNQYEAWRKKQDWIADKNAEESAKSAGVPF